MNISGKTNRLDTDKKNNYSIDMEEEIIIRDLRKQFDGGNIPLALTITDISSLIDKLGNSYISYIRRSYKFSKIFRRRGYMPFMYVFIILTQVKKLKGHKITIEIPENKKEEFIRLVYSLPIYRQLKRMQAKKEIDNNTATIIYITTVLGINKDFDIDELIKKLKLDKMKLMSFPEIRNDITVKYGDKIGVNIE